MRIVFMCYIIIIVSRCSIEQGSSLHLSKLGSRTPLSSVILQPLHLQVFHCTCTYFLNVHLPCQVLNPKRSIRLVLSIALTTVSLMTENDVLRVYKLLGILPGAKAVTSFDFLRQPCEAGIIIPNF